MLSFEKSSTRLSNGLQSKPDILAKEFFSAPHTSKGFWSICPQTIVFAARTGGKLKLCSCARRGIFTPWRTHPKLVTDYRTVSILFAAHGSNRG